MRKQFRFGFAIALAVALIFSFTSCEKESSEEAPGLPPVESMMMDFSDFSEPPASSKSSASTTQNFVRSYLSVGFWNVSVTLVSALPVAAYAHALQQTPVYLSDHWEWTYEFALNNVSYDATLTAKRMNNQEFNVEMMIGLSAFPDNAVKWFDGVVSYNHTKADWTFYKDGTIPVMAIAWNKDFESQAADLTYTYTEPDQVESGSFIMWEYIPGAVYDAAYAISMAAGTTNIEWNVSTIEGRIKDPVFFGDENWHCWDSHANGLVDRECK